MMAYLHLQAFIFPETSAHCGGLWLVRGGLEVGAPLGLCHPVRFVEAAPAAEKVGGPWKSVGHR